MARSLRPITCRKSRSLLCNDAGRWGGMLNILLRFAHTAFCLPYDEAIGSCEWERIYLINRAPENTFYSARDNKFTYGLLALLFLQASKKGSKQEYEKKLKYHASHSKNQRHAMGLAKIFYSSALYKLFALHPFTSCKIIHVSWWLNMQREISRRNFFTCSEFGELRTRRAKGLLKSWGTLSCV